jgi:NhaA family Na+:H+ antiporter
MGMLRRLRVKVGKMRAGEAPAPLMVLLPFQRFLQTEASGGILLLAATALALIFANSPLAGLYNETLQTEIAISVGGAHVAESVLDWINEGLMALFFLVVGLEIKREVVVGDLRSFQRAALSVVAAIGGAVAPAAVYIALNASGPGSRGWGIPIGTDTAFTLGVLALLGRGIPSGLRTFLASFAIVDDVVAILVISVAYTDHISWVALAVAAGCFILLMLANFLGVRRLAVYAVLGVTLWLAMLGSGVHATVAGILVALTIPVRSRIDSSDFVRRAREYLGAFAASRYSGLRMLTNEEQQAALEALADSAEQFMVPLQRVESALHPWVAYLIVPIFALANAGIAINAGFARALTQPVTLGVLLGLVVGKPVGVFLSTWVATRARIAVLPESVTWRHMFGVAFLGGIGFTMSLFITDLAFESGAFFIQAKVGILLGSLVAGVIGWLILRGATRTANGANSGAGEPI